jgi:hypothetical protein
MLSRWQPLGLPGRKEHLLFGGGPAMDIRQGIAKEMAAYTRDGETLGKVVSVDDAGFFVEKGLFFPKEFGFRFDDVEDVRGDGVHLRLEGKAVEGVMRERGRT